jgi:anti-anti-sigma regulatory factor
MLRIKRATNGEVVLLVSGQIDAENVSELKNLIDSEDGARPIVLDLKELTLVDRDAIKFLDHCESVRVQLKNCPAYVREWIARERDAT